MSESDLLSGDDAVHGEAAYFLNDELETTSGLIVSNHHDDVESGAITPELTEKKTVV
jgi:hypothetical protein